MILRTGDGEDCTCCGMFGGILWKGWGRTDFMNGLDKKDYTRDNCKGFGKENMSLGGLNYGNCN